jgi:hypothetical protein
LCCAMLAGEKDVRPSLRRRGVRNAQELHSV